jgi:hypothetical protein
MAVIPNLWSHNGHSNLLPYMLSFIYDIYSSFFSVTKVKIKVQGVLKNGHF